MPEKWSGIEEVAVYLDVTKDTIRNWIKKTDIPAHKLAANGNSSCQKLTSGFEAEKVQLTKYEVRTRHGRN